MGLSPTNTLIVVIVCVVVVAAAAVLLWQYWPSGGPVAPPTPDSPPITVPTTPSAAGFSPLGWTFNMALDDATNVIDLATSSDEKYLVTLEAGPVIATKANTLRVYDLTTTTTASLQPAVFTTPDQNVSVMSISKTVVFYALYNAGAYFVGLYATGATTPSDQLKIDATLNSYVPIAMTCTPNDKYVFVVTQSPTGGACKIYRFDLVDGAFLSGEDSALRWKAGDAFSNVTAAPTVFKVVNGMLAVGDATTVRFYAVDQCSVLPVTVPFTGSFDMLSTLTVTGNAVAKTVTVGEGVMAAAGTIVAGAAGTITPSKLLRTTGGFGTKVSASGQILAVVDLGEGRNMRFSTHVSLYQVAGVSPDLIREEACYVQNFPITKIVATPTKVWLLDGRTIRYLAAPAGTK